MTNAAGTTDESSPAQCPPPTLLYWHVWADDGATHQTRCTLSAFHLQSMGGRAAPQWNDALVTGDATVLIGCLPAGWVGEWHGNPKPQWIVPLSGRWFVETTDGTRVDMGPGEVSFGGDQSTKPDEAGRQGHRSGTVGGVPAVLMVVQLHDPKWVNARPGAFA